MTVEASTFIYISSDDWVNSFSSIADQAHRCLLRQSKVAPGDRQEVTRYDALCRQLEQLAWWRLEGGAPAISIGSSNMAFLDGAVRAPRHSWITAPEDVPNELCAVLAPLLERLKTGGALFELRDPFTPGQSGATLTVGNSPIAPAVPWRAPHDERGLDAVFARWDGQLAAAASGGTEPVVPSGVSNRILTEGLRRYVARDPDRANTVARVVYRDGSEAKPFPLGALDLSADLPVDRTILRLALLSLRHPEMDSEVDGAWLRNRDVSQVRPAAETDMLVYETSLRQLQDLQTHGPLVIYLYQTGLEPAVVGFYRALAEFLVKFSGSIAVSPR